jgi:hypothetical protein
MSRERYTQLVVEVCEASGLYNVDEVLRTRRIQVEGFDVVVDHVDADPGAMYLQFDYGITAASRTLAVFRLMLESNLLVYAQDQAQLGLDPDTGGALLIVRVPMHDDIDGTWLAETLVHYAEHGRYWRNNMQQASDETFEGISAGQYQWLRA